MTKFLKLFLPVLFFFALSLFIPADSFASHNSCVPQYAVSCNPVCGTAGTCGQKTTCIDNCGHRGSAGQCDACPTPAPSACKPTHAISCSPRCGEPSTCGQITRCYDNCGNFFTGQCDACPTSTPPPVVCTIREGTCTACTKICGTGTQQCFDTCGKEVTRNCNTQACGVTSQTQQCQNGQWVDVGSPTCVANCVPPPPAPTPPPPECNTGIANCSVCGVACGNGVQQCQYTQYTGGGNCTPTNTIQPCTRNCPRPQEQTCVANACIEFGNPWIQSVGGSMRFDRGFMSKVPATAVDGPYASLRGSGGTPGLIFTGDSTPDFGSGQPSQQPQAWVVGGTFYPNLYAPVRQGGIVKTSYNFLLAKTKQGSIPTIDIAQYCSGGISNCSLQSMPNGVYIANGSLTLNAFNFPANRNIVILVTGNLRINGRITVPVGSTATFSASGDITIDRNIGEAVTSTVSTIEGVYSADRNFIVDGINNCLVGTDIRLNVGGHVIANATLTNASFQNLRNLCTSNRLYPSVYVKERADFILNTPEFLKQPNFTYQEIAP